MGLKTKTATKGSETTVEGYLSRLALDQQKIVASLIKIVRESAPEASVTIKWAQPVFEPNGPFCYIRAFKNHINFGFWRGAKIQSGKGILLTGGEKMAYIKIAKESDVQRELFQKWVREAVQLNLTKGDPTKQK